MQKKIKLNRDKKKKKETNQFARALVEPELHEGEISEVIANSLRR